MLDWRSEPCSATRVGPAIRSRPWGAMLRIGGLALCTAERPRSGTSLLVAGCSPGVNHTVPIAGVTILLAPSRAHGRGVAVIPPV